MSEQQQAPHRQAVLNEVAAECADQEAQWGGAAHDDAHTAFEWLAILLKHAGRAATAILDEREEEAHRRHVTARALRHRLRLRLIKVAAICVSWVMALERADGRERP